MLFLKLLVVLGRRFDDVGELLEFIQKFMAFGDVVKHLLLLLERYPMHLVAKELYRGAVSFLKVVHHFHL